MNRLHIHPINNETASFSQRTGFWKYPLPAFDINSGAFGVSIGRSRMTGKP